VYIWLVLRCNNTASFFFKTHNKTIPVLYLP